MHKIELALKISIQLQAMENKDSVGKVLQHIQISLYLYLQIQQENHIGRPEQHLFFLDVRVDHLPQNQLPDIQGIEVLLPVLFSSDSWFSLRAPPNACPATAVAAVPVAVAFRSVVVVVAAVPVAVAFC